ncbi:hypothetical protein GGR53DRAFT_470340 [Hypoxylon sp. FL1150]|nr:hypothetical protein GGR53DRAFT_470340 [Hypoxylon sp. FL1150]
MANSGFDGVNAGQTVYYIRSVAPAILRDNRRGLYWQIAPPGLPHMCLRDINTRDPQVVDFPSEPCPMGITTALQFPTWLRGQEPGLGRSRGAYGVPGERHPTRPGGGGPARPRDAVRMSQLFYGVNWDTGEFNNGED